jgi:hypothetical protein
MLAGVTSVSNISSDTLFPSELKEGILIVDAQASVMAKLQDKQSSLCLIKDVTPNDIFMVMCSNSQLYHDGIYLATLIKQAAKDGFKKVVVVESGFQQWRTIKMMRGLGDEKQAKEVALKEGKEWEQRNQPTLAKLQGELNIKIELVSWPNFDDIAGYQNLRSEVMSFFRTAGTNAAKDFPLIVTGIRENFESQLAARKKQKLFEAGAAGSSPVPNCLPKTAGEDIKEYVYDEETVYGKHLIPKYAQLAQQNKGRLILNYFLTYRNPLLVGKKDKINSNFLLVGTMVSLAGNPKNVVITDAYVVGRALSQQKKANKSAARLVASMAAASATSNENSGYGGALALSTTTDSLVAFGSSDDSGSEGSSEESDGQRDYHADHDDEKAEPENAVSADGEYEIMSQGMVVNNKVVVVGAQQAAARWLTAYAQAKRVDLEEAAVLLARKDEQLEQMQQRQKQIQRQKIQQAASTNSGKSTPPSSPSHAATAAGVRKSPPKPHQSAGGLLQHHNGKPLAESKAAVNNGPAAKGGEPVPSPKPFAHQSQQQISSNGDAKDKVSKLLTDAAQSAGSKPPAGSVPHLDLSSVSAVGSGTCGGGRTPISDPNRDRVSPTHSDLSVASSTDSEGSNSNASAAGSRSSSSSTCSSGDSHEQNPFVQASVRSKSAEGVRVVVDAKAVSGVQKPSSTRVAMKRSKSADNLGRLSGVFTHNSPSLPTPVVPLVPPNTGATVTAAACKK